MYQIQTTNRFEKEAALCKKRGLNMFLLKNVNGSPVTGS